MAEQKNADLDTQIATAQATVDELQAAITTLDDTYQTQLATLTTTAQQEEVALRAQVESLYTDLQSAYDQIADQQQAAAFHQGQHILRPRALANPHRVDQREQDDCPTGTQCIGRGTQTGQVDILRKPHRRSGIPGKDKRHQRDIAGTNNGQLHPTEQEPSQRPVGTSQVDVVPSLPRVGRSELRVAAGTRQ